MTTDDARPASPPSLVDRLGALASSLCAVHCLLVALLPASLAALGLGSLLGHGAEWVFVALSIGFATVALVMGWRRHRSFAIAALLVLGIAGLLVSRGLEMGAEGHHEEHALEEASAAHGDEGHADGHGDHGHDGHADGHLVGTVVGVGAGLLLLVGHLLSHRALKRCAQPGCSDETNQAAQQPS
ncbi:MAG: MerC domain-containing protein [Sandaracinaceae bacterium]